MAIPFVLGERVLLPTRIAPYTAGRDEPRSRPLWIYASDPANVGLRQPLLRVDVPYEPLAPGPQGVLFEVEHGPLPEDLRQLLDWSKLQADEYAGQPLDLDRLSVAIGAGLTPTTGDPRFAGQMIYAVCQQIYHVFRHALGRNPCWGPWAADRIDRGERPRLRIIPCSFNDANAFYDPEKGTLEFGYFAADPTNSPYVLPGGLVLLSLSRDIVAHELTHAILDGMRSEFMRDTHLDVGAFHEAFADLVALFHHFTQSELVERAIAEGKGDVNSDLLFGLGRQFGEAINGPAGGALRRALARGEGPESEIGPAGRYYPNKPREEHDRGSILVAAVFEAYVRVYRRHTEKLFKVVNMGRPRDAGDLSTEVVQLLAASAQKVAEHFLKICIRAIDYCPPIDIQFGSYLRALVTADTDVVPEDSLGYRDSFIKAFRRRDISIKNVRDLSEDSLQWRPPDLAETHIPDLAFGRLRFTDNGLNQPTRAEVVRRAKALGNFIVGDPSRLRSFGLRQPGGPYRDITIQSIRLAHRIGPDGIPRDELVCEVTQARRARGNTFIGGSTVIVGMDGNIRYLIRRRVDDVRRRREEMRHAGAAGAAPLNLRKIHRARVGAKSAKS
ncbi:MAG TPA: hypothetical protein PLW68_05295 [Casimicrobiaceae bacterium]|nr:hypothetical protein [Casimicrobiaceae bacterium]